MIIYPKKGEYVPQHLNLSGATCFHCNRPFSDDARAIAWFSPHRNGQRERIVLHPKCAYTMSKLILSELPHIAYGDSKDDTTN
jgi:biotin synthase-related radical SAM superfamily protein